MSLVTGIVKDVAKNADNTRWLFSSVLRESADGTWIVSTKTFPVTPVDGVLTVDLDPGFVIATSNGVSYPITVPDGPADLWDLIKAAVAVPPGTPEAMLAAAIAAYFEDNPVGELDPEVIAQAVGDYLEENPVSGGGVTVPQRNSCVLIGDSIAEFGHYGFFYAPFLGANFMNLLNIQSNQRIKWGGTYAVGGYNLTQVRDNKLPQVLALDPKPGACIISGGTNDVANIGGAWSLAYTSGVLIDIIDGLQAAGIAPILSTIPPHGENASFNPAVYEWNNWVRRYAETNGFALLDVYAAVAGDDGAMKSGWSGDGLHFNQLGHIAVADRAIADGLPDLFPPAGILTARSSDDLTNLVNNGSANQGLFLVDTNSDGTADGWTKTGTGTCSRVTPDDADDLRGQWQKIARTTGSTTGDCTLAFAVDDDLWNPGDVVSFSARVRTENMATAQSVWWLGLSSTVAGGFTYPNGSVVASAASGPYSWGVDIDGTLYVEFEIPAGTTALTVQASVGAVAGTGNPSLEVGEVTVRNLGEAVVVPTAPTITTTSLPTMTVGELFSQTLAATGTTPITWSVTSGSLPDGLDLDTNTISGEPTTAGPYSFTLTATNSEGTDTQPFTGTVAEQVTLPGTLLGEWKFAGDNLNDSSGHGRHGTFEAGSGGGTLTYGLGHTAGTRAITFANATNRINVGRTGLEATADGVTIMGWIRLNGTPGNDTLGVLSKARASTSSRSRVGARYTAGEKIASGLARWKDDIHVADGSAIDDNNWHHVALVDGNTQWILYVDGNLSVNGTRSFDNTTSPTWEAFDWFIGRNESIGDVYADPVMSVSGVRIIQGQLTQAEVQEYRDTP